VAVSDFDLLAASLRADARDVGAFVEALAAKLTASFPGAAKVERKGGFLGGPKRVRRVAVGLGDDEFELERDDDRVTCRRRTVVRGIALKNEELELETWIDGLSHALVRQAEASGRGREALERLLR
jgi:hypothetical protein